MENSLEQAIGPLIERAVEEGYSDIYLGPDIVHYRQAGIVRPVDPDTDFAIDPQKLRAFAITLLETAAPHLIARPQVRQDRLEFGPGEPSYEGDLRSLPDQTRHNVRFTGAEEALDYYGSVDVGYTFRAGRVRAKVFLAGGNVRVTMRIIPSHPGTYEELGLPAHVLDALPAINNGLFLVSGPTDSGKTTTIAAIIHQLAEQLPASILTIEDPIEYVIPSSRALVVQREIGRDTPSMALALDDALRQTPDVIMIGEIRSPEVMRAALNLAATGHLVLASWHAPDVASALSRIVDIYPPEQQPEINSLLRTTLRGVLAQRLLPNFNQTSRVLAYEYLPVTDAVRAQIERGNYAQVYNNSETISFCRTLRDLLRSRKIDEVTYTANRPTRCS